MFLKNWRYVTIFFHTNSPEIQFTELEISHYRGGKGRDQRACVCVHMLDGGVGGGFLMKLQFSTLKPSEGCSLGRDDALGGYVDQNASLRLDVSAPHVGQHRIFHGTAVQHGCRHHAHVIYTHSALGNVAVRDPRRDSKELSEKVRLRGGLHNRVLPCEEGVPCFFGTDGHTPL